jgi:hypothetical protein
MTKDYISLGLPAMSLADWAGLFAFMNRSWFKRSWVVQEVSFAREAIYFYGASVIPEPVLTWSTEFLDRSVWGCLLSQLATGLLTRPRCLSEGEDGRSSGG